MNSNTDRLGRSDAGFTLVEVIVSIVLVGLLGLSAAYLAIRGTQASSSQQRANIATTVAVQAMEDIIARQSAIETTTGVTALVGGRHADAVNAAWTAYGAHSITTSMYPLVDPTAAVGATQRIPLTSSRVLDGTDFTVATLIGSCYRTPTSGECTTVSGVLTRPDSPPSGLLEAIRVAVIVEWTAGAGCQDTPCSYELVTMIDLNEDVEWVTSG